jgi:hypothetical protein
MLVIVKLNLVKIKHVYNVHRKDLKVNGKIKINLRKTACGDNDRLMVVHGNRVGFHKICNSS